MSRTSTIRNGSAASRAFLALDLFAFGGFLEVRVDFRSLALVERQLGKARQSPQLRRGGEMA
jgi:hypothetical protein